MTIGKLSGQCDFGQKGQSYCNQRGQSCVAKRVKVAWLFHWERKYYRAITGNFRSYLYTSVHNAALAVLKKKKLVPMELLTGVPVEIPQEAVLEREELERQEKELMLKLEKLPKQEIAAIKAVILENKKCVEAALELGMSVNTLKTHLARALKKLRKDYHLSFLFYSF